jgi:hypothetical protein
VPGRLNLRDTGNSNGRVATASTGASDRPHPEFELECVDWGIPVLVVDGSEIADRTGVQLLTRPSVASPFAQSSLPAW